MAIEPLQVVVRLCPPGCSSRQSGGSFGNSSRSGGSRKACAVVVDSRRNNVVHLHDPSNESHSALTANSHHATLLERRRDGATKAKSFQVDRAFSAGTTNESLFQSAVAPLVAAAVEGFRCTCFAHGYTGTGKTHAMCGTPRDPGFLPRALELIFESIQEVTATSAAVSTPSTTQSDVSTTQGTHFVVRVGYVQLYDGKFFDLLQDFTEPMKEPRPIELHEDPFLGPHLRGSLSLRTTVETLREAQALYAHGRAALIKGWRAGFRGHAIFTVHLERHDLRSGDIRLGCLHLVDLAGCHSVRVATSTKAELQDACINNKSLVVLGNVLAAAARRSKHEDNCSFVPYRDSKLTFFLKDSLGGKSKSLLLVTVDPAIDAFTQTKATLDFALRARQIRNFPEIICSPYKSAFTVRRRPPSPQNTVASQKQADDDDALRVRKHLFHSNYGASKNLEGVSARFQGSASRPGAQLLSATAEAGPLADLANIIRANGANARVLKKTISSVGGPKNLSGQAKGETRERINEPKATGQQVQQQQFELKQCRRANAEQRRELEARRAENAAQRREIERLNLILARQASSGQADRTSVQALGSTMLEDALNIAVDLRKKLEATTLLHKKQMECAEERHLSRLRMREQQLSRCTAELKLLRNKVADLESATAQARDQFAHELSKAREKEHILQQQAQHAQNGWQLQTAESTRLEKLNINSECAIELLEQQHQQMASQWSEKEARNMEEVLMLKRIHASMKEELNGELKHANATAERYHAELAQADQNLEEQAEGAVAQLTSELQRLRGELRSRTEDAAVSQARAQQAQKVLQIEKASLQGELETAGSENAASLRSCISLESEVRQMSQALKQGFDAKELLEASLKEKQCLLSKLEIDIAKDDSVQVATQRFESANAALQVELEQAKQKFQEESRILQEQLAAAQENTNMVESRAAAGLVAARLELQGKLDIASSELQNAQALAAEGTRFKEECSEIQKARDEEVAVFRSEIERLEDANANFLRQEARDTSKGLSENSEKGGIEAVVVATPRSEHRQCRVAINLLKAEKRALFNTITELQNENRRLHQKQHD